MRKIALIDLDKTLYNGYTLIDFILNYVIPNNLTSKKNVEAAKKLVNEFTNQTISYNDATAQGVALAGEILKGRTVAEVKEWQFHFFNIEKIFPFAPQLLEKLKKNSFEIYIVSATVEPVVSHIANELGVQSFSSQIETKDGIYTGKVLKLLNEEAKAEIVKQLEIGTIDLLSLGFGDSSGDLDLLKVVDHAFVLEPKESEVIKTAEKNQWHVVTRDTILPTVSAIIET
ncbi:MAG: hypothetical protein BroJett025_03700 [Patescibacteria group bacterium]|nr:MAG: hypothetical protein BroJett025_03700 [Patescibacteria group bacterium]